MKKTRSILLLLGAVALLAATRPTRAATPKPLVRLAELEIDPAQLPAYTAALREGMAAAIRTEPGVLTLYAVAVKGQPTHIRLFEMYADQAAYQAHLRTPHFLRYKQTTLGMVKSLTLLDTDPILLAAKPDVGTRIH